ncbi:MAG: protein kinase domain-containing protein, partial [Gemmatimonadaceae bacterium]
MPYIEGPSLRERLTRSPLPLDEAIGILHDVALGLEYAHAHQVVHRDIKPENVLLSRRTAVVADFGLAKAITAATQTASASTLTLAESIVGTPAYMAPEQAAGGTVDSRTDLYAWGVMAYEMLASEHPFADRATPQAMVVAQIADQPMRLAARRPDLPAALTALVDDCMAKDPEQRPADATTLVKRLDAAVPARGHRRGPSRLQWATAVVIVGLLAAAGLWGYRHASDVRWARQDAQPLAARLAASDFSLPAVAVLRRAQAYLPHDTAIAHALAANTRLVTITSSPPGASVAIQDYGTPDSGWVTLGATPITPARIPRGYLRWKVSKPGVGEFVSAPVSADTMDFPLGAVVGAPAGMVPVGADKWDAYIGTVGWMGPFALPAFFLDRFEVTNRQYQQFVDAGGYQHREYWSEPFIRDGRTLAWSQAMALFRDRAGRAGPSTWEGGHYPEGQADNPVSGISWYEAMAYAKFVGKSLPSFAQWYEAAPAAIARYVVGASNISRSGPAAVGTFRGLGPYGTYDMAGNVREWVLNALNADNRFILGGASSSPTYLYSEPASLPAFDRSASNGMRCVRN